MIAEYFIGTP